MKPPTATPANPTSGADSLAEDRYALLEAIGSGGMASVYRAYDKRLDCYRAIKVLADGLSERESLRNRFLSEAQTMAKLHHPHVVTVHDVGEEDGRYYMVMELLEGGSLMDRLKTNGPMPPRMASAVLRPVLSGLARAHARGVVHRDIKPHNILVTQTGIPKLTDFGIAHIGGSSTSDTRTGTMMGTLAYMAPEQRNSARRVDARSDIYSAGATLYTLLTCKEPHDIFASELQGEMFDGLEPALATIIRRATRYKQEDRYQTVLELQKALKSAHPGLPGDEEQPWAGLEPERLLTEEQYSEPSIPPQTEKDNELAALSTMLGTDLDPSTAEELLGDVTLIEESTPQTHSGTKVFFWVVALAMFGLAVVQLVPRTQDDAKPPVIHDLVAPEASKAPRPEPVIAPGLAEPEDPEPDPADPEPAPGSEPTQAVVVDPPAADQRLKPIKPAKQLVDPAPPGKLGLNSVPHSTVSVDGEVLGRSGRIFELPSGEYTVTLVTQDGRQKQRQLSVGAGERQVWCWDFNKGTDCLR